MKNSKFTENLGLKIVSVIAAFILWLVVINVDDPVINRTYTGIPVEVVNEDIIEKQGKCYEVLGNSDTITVVVSAKRSVLDNMSRDYIKATADAKALTSFETMPIEIKVTRFADAIESVTSRTESIQIKLEDIVTRKVPIEVVSLGQVEDGYLLASVESKFEELEISGPESYVSEVAKAVCEIDINGINADESVSTPLYLCYEDGNVIEEEKIKKSQENVSVNVVVWATKEVPITCNASGTAADGYSVMGTPIVAPGSVVITGRSAYLNSMTSVVIPSENISVTGATDDVVKTIDLNEFLPEGIKLADESFDGNVKVSISVEPNDRKMVEIPMVNITIENVPEGYKAFITDIGPTIQVEVQGKGDTFDRFDGSLAMGSIDATKIVPRDIVADDEVIATGVSDGKVEFTFPTGVSETSPVYLELVVDVDNE